MRLLIADGFAQWQELDRRITGFDAEFTAFTREHEAAKRLLKITSVGVTIASALMRPWEMLKPSSVDEI